VLVLLLMFFVAETQYGDIKTTKKHAGCPLSLIGLIGWVDIRLK
jgi:hypothetical protein